MGGERAPGINAAISPPHEKAIIPSPAFIGSITEGVGGDAAAVMMEVAGRPQTSRRCGAAGAAGATP